MSLFNTPESHAANSPETWKVVKRADRLWAIITFDLGILETFSTKRDAERNLEQGWLVDQYNKEGRWYAGEDIPGWRSWADCLADRNAVSA